MSDKITIDNFDTDNRRRQIGHSIYQICRTQENKWYILENYNDGKIFSRGRGYYSDDLQYVIDILNSFAKEREIADKDLTESEYNFGETGEGDMWKHYACMTPKNFSDWLRTKGGIVGQDEAVKAASMIIYNHIHGRSSVNLFAAPSGSGKSHLWSVLQRELGTDKIIINDASMITAEGWKGGTKISTIFKNIPAECRERVIFVLDEFDKLLEPQYGANGTNYSDLTQNQLLRLFNNDTVFFGGEGEQGFSVNASGISIVLLGSFQRVMEKKSSVSGSIGFGKKPHCECDYGNSELTVEDLISYGMRQEIAGRITRIISMNPLGTDALIKIGQQEVKNIEKQLNRKVSVDDNVLFDIACKAKDKGLGARWLKSQLNNAINELIYENPNAEQFIIDFDALYGNVQKQTAAYIEGSLYNEKI